MRASLNHDEDIADAIDLAQALNAMVERKDLQDGYDADGSPLEIAFLCVRYSSIDACRTVKARKLTEGADIIQRDGSSRPLGQRHRRFAPRGTD